VDAIIGDLAVGVESAKSVLWIHFNHWSDPWVPQVLPWAEVSVSFVIWTDFFFSGLS
jgi:hypothetical protein